MNVLPLTREGPRLTLEDRPLTQGGRRATLVDQNIFKTNPNTSVNVIKDHNNINVIRIEITSVFHRPNVTNSTTNNNSTINSSSTTKSMQFVICLQISNMDIMSSLPNSITFNSSIYNNNNTTTTTNTAPREPLVTLPVRVNPHPSNNGTLTIIPRAERRPCNVTHNQTSSSSKTKTHKAELLLCNVIHIKTYTGN